MTPNEKLNPPTEEERGRIIGGLQRQVQSLLEERRRLLDDLAARTERVKELEGAAKRVIARQITGEGSPGRYASVAEMNADFMRDRIAELEAENATLRAALATPEVYAGVVQEQVARERETALRECERLRGLHRLALSRILSLVNDLDRRIGVAVTQGFVREGLDNIRREIERELP